MVGEMGELGGYPEAIYYNFSAIDSDEKECAYFVLPRNKERKF